MRILADENFPWEAVHALRQHGYDVAWARTDTPGANDRDLLKQAQAEGRIIMTFDKDFGELAFHYHLPANSGVILFRIAPSSATEIARFAVSVFEERTDWPGHFCVVETNRIRLTPLPDTKR